jgi:hypothetical protein
MDPPIIQLTGLSNAQVALLTEAGVTNSEELMALTHEDICALLPNGSLLLRRKLSNVAEYLSSGQNIVPNTTMPDIHRHLSNRKNPAPIQLPPPPPAAMDPTRGAPKMSINGLEDYCGGATKWPDWEMGTEATIGQSAYAEFLTNPPDPTDLSKMTRNKEFYNMLVKATNQGSATHLTSKYKNDGHATWVHIQSWYNGESTSRLIIEHFRDKLSKLELDQDETASSFINDFIICHKRLDEKDEGVTAASKRESFLDKIVDDDYNITKGFLTMNPLIEFDDCVKAIRKQETQLELKDNKSNSKRARRTIEDDDSDEVSNKRARRFKGDNNASNDGPSIPSIPKSILYKIQPEHVRRNLIRWRGIYNDEGRQIRPDELQTQDSSTSAPHKKSKQKAGGSSKGSNNKNHDTKPKGTKATKARRVTTTKPAGSKALTAKVYFKDNVDNDDSSVGDEDESLEEDSDTKLGSSTKNPAKSKRGRRNPVTRRGRATDETPRAIIDPGTDFELLGGVGWKILGHHSGVTQLDGALAGMTGVQLPTVEAITAFDNPDTGLTTIIGVGMAAFDARIEQTETLLNSHELRKHGVIVDDKAKRDGGNQRIEVDGIIIPLELDKDERIMSISLRQPTDQEISENTIHWLIPTTLDRSARRAFARRQMMATEAVPEQTTDRSPVIPAPWKDRLGHPPEAVTTKTLLATTQLCSDPVEMENREAPHQHRKSRVLPLHPKRIKGRTDSDTFFSSIKSIAGFTCVQIFVSLLSQFIFVRCMRREAHSHGAYQDFVRNIGAPNILLTDNSQTQTGKKWTATSRANVTKQINSVPHNQNQNHAERKIQDVKKRVIMTLRYAKAPLVFWCYCLHFIVDCFNHTAREGLDWRTPMEKLHGHTPDISMFRFAFWEPVWYYEPTAKFPQPNFLPGRFVGIAWDHGDALTYQIWTTPNNDWNKGRLLIRNVVRGRHQQEDEPKISYKNSDLAFTRPETTTKQQKKKRKQNGKRKHSSASDNETEQPPCAKVIRINDTPQTIGDNESEERGGIVDADGNSNSNTSTHSAQASTSNPKRPRENEDDEEPIDIDFNPLDNEQDIEMVDEVNDELPGNQSNSEVGGARIDSILQHESFRGELKLKVWWNTEEATWEVFRDMKEDYPKLTATYIVDNNVASSTTSTRNPNLQWAKKTLRDLKRSIRRVARLYDFYLDEDDVVRKVRRAQQGGNKKKKRKNYGKPVFMWGIQVPRTTRQALEFDQENSNTFWQDSIRKEVTALTELECFDFKDDDFKCADDYQKTTLTMIFSVKHDLRRKSRLVAGGHLIDALDLDIYSSTVKSISVKLLHVISHKQKLTQLCGDIGNA